MEIKGFEKFVLAPAVPKDLGHVNSSYISPYGKIVSNWKKSDNKVHYELEARPALRLSLSWKKI
jgi:alpha-L-rhamnosidase